MPAALELRNVSKSFGTFHAVQGLSLSVPVGSVYGFLGPNGAGKTTSLRMILVMLLPDTACMSGGVGVPTTSLMSLQGGQRAMYLWKADGNTSSVSVASPSSSTLAGERPRLALGNSACARQITLHRESGGFAAMLGLAQLSPTSDGFHK